MLLPLKKIFPAVFSLFLVSYASDSLAQLRIYPADAQRTTPTMPRGDATARTKADTPLTLPFFDDFSKPYKHIYPDTSLWESSSSVWVNDGMAIKPPTINVATFDGLDSKGSPYNSNEILLTGYTDTLMSRPIDLSDASLPVSERDGVYLSFFYQWQGNLEPPDQKDYLELSFKSKEEDTEAWEIVMKIYPKDEVDPTVFYDTIIQISDERFFHESFQFRFRAFGRLSGPFDTWHVDYVYLNKGRDINDLSFPDRAIATQLGPLFGQYRAIPRHHFFSNDQLSQPYFGINNMKNEPASVNFRTEGFFSSVNRKDDIAYPTHQTVISKATPIKITNNVLLAKEHVTIRLDTLPNINDPLQFPPDEGIDSTLIRLTVALQTRDNIPFNTTPPIEPDSTGDYTKNYIPIRFTTNDTLTADYVLSDYLAYDDGVAEYSAGLIEAGNLIAYEFEIDTTYALKQDTLIAFDIYFPPYAITSNQLVDFFIYGEDPNNPGFPGEQLLRISSRPIRRLGLNQFQRIPFLPAVLIDKKKFYIGWRQPASGRAMVGLDISNDTGDKIFVNTNGFWYQNEDVRGSLMVRPVFGSGIIDARVGIEEGESAASLYPNPNSGTFIIEGDINDVRLFSITGQSVPISVEPLTRGVEVTLERFVPGVFVVRYKLGDILKSQKIIVRE